MIELKNKKDCCGCCVCASACPKGCIEMREDEEGFVYPQIDRVKCINCYLCEKACPMLNVFVIVPVLFPVPTTVTVAVPTLMLFL